MLRSVENGKLVRLVQSSLPIKTKLMSNKKKDDLSLFKVHLSPADSVSKCTYQRMKGEGSIFLIYSEIERTIMKMRNGFIQDVASSDCSKPAGTEKVSTDFARLQVFVLR